MPPPVYFAFPLTTAYTNMLSLSFSLCLFWDVIFEMLIFASLSLLVLVKTMELELKGVPFPFSSLRFPDFFCLSLQFVVD